MAPNSDAFSPSWLSVLGSGHVTPAAVNVFGVGQPPCSLLSNQAEVNLNIFSLFFPNSSFSY